MNSYKKARTGLQLEIASNQMFGVEAFSRTAEKTLLDVRDYLRFRRVIKRAVCRETAPQHLVDSIRKMIRG